MWRRRNSTLWQWPEVRYLVVGGSNTVLGLAIIYLLKWIGDFGDIFANMIGYTCGLVASFIFNAKWTFSYKGSMLPALVRFVIVLLAAYLSNLMTVVTAISVYDVNDYVAQGLGIVPYTLVGYLGSRFFAFRGPRSRSAPPRSCSNATSDALIPPDADLEDPPELIPASPRPPALRRKVARQKLHGWNSS